MHVCISASSLHRPLFSYWLMAVHVLILIVTLSVYGFAPFGYGLFRVQSLVRDTCTYMYSLSTCTCTYIIICSFVHVQTFYLATIKHMCTVICPISDEQQSLCRDSTKMRWRLQWMYVRISNLLVYLGQHYNFCSDYIETGITMQGLFVVAAPAILDTILVTMYFTNK